MNNQNNTMIIYPYLLDRTWVFDSPENNLKEEAFVLGMSEMITRLVKSKATPNPRSGFALHFSNREFNDFDAELTWLRSDDSQVVPGQNGSASQVCGNWYRGIIFGVEMQGWLCPALGLYFASAPARLFVRVDPLPDNIDPIWRISPNRITNRFVSGI